MTIPTIASIKIVGGRPGWTFHLHGDCGRLDFEGRFGKSGVLKIEVARDFYSVLHTAVTWFHGKPGDPGDEGGVSLPLQIRAGDTVEIGF